MWFKIDDNFLNHEKLEEFEGEPARWSRNISVWLACGLYCSQNQTDGLLRVSRVRRLCALGVDVDSALDDLRMVGLIDEIDGSSWVHDFLEYNPSKEQQDDKRRKHAETQRKYRDKARDREASRKAARDTSRNNHPDITLPITQPLGDNGRDTPPYRTVPYRTEPYRTEKSTAPIGTDTHDKEPVMWSQNLRKEIRRLKRTQAEVAGQMFVGTKTVQGWCSGELRPSEDEQVLINKVMAKFRREHVDRVQRDKSVAKRYQDDVCHVFDEMYFAKFGSRSTWSGKQYAAIKRLRQAGHSTQLVLDKAKIMFSWVGERFPCKDSCDFMTLSGHFDLFVEKPKAEKVTRPLTRAARHRAAEEAAEEAARR